MASIYAKMHSAPMKIRDDKKWEKPQKVIASQRYSNIFTSILLLHTIALPQTLQPSLCFLWAEEPDVDFQNPHVALRALSLAVSPSRALQQAPNISPCPVALLFLIVVCIFSHIP